MYDEDWENFRAEVHEWVKQREEGLLKRWIDEIGCKDPVGYYRDAYNKTMELYSTRPGALIGKTGVNIDRLKQMLTDEFHGDWRVKLVEVRGGFVNI